MKINKTRILFLSIILLATQIAFSQMVVEVTPLRDPNSSDIAYSSDMPNYHHYTDTTFLCKVDKYTLEEVYSIFISKSKFLAPVYGDQPVFDGCTLLLSISVLGIEFPGLHPIKVVFNKQQHKITNYTLPKHILHPGKVDRQIIEINGSIFLITEGVGAISTDKFFHPYSGSCQIAQVTANLMTSFERSKFGETVSSITAWLNERLKLGEMGSSIAAWLNERQCIVDDVWDPVDAQLAKFIEEQPPRPIQTSPIPSNTQSPYFTTDFIWKSSFPRENKFNKTGVKLLTNNGNLITEMYIVYPYTINDVKKQFVIFRGYKNENGQNLENHIGVPKLTIARYVYKNGLWSLEKFVDDFQSIGGGSGKPPRISVGARNGKYYLWATSYTSAGQTENYQFFNLETLGKETVDLSRE